MRIRLLFYGPSMFQPVDHRLNWTRSIHSDDVLGLWEKIRFTVMSNDVFAHTTNVYWTSVRSPPHRKPLTAKTRHQVNGHGSLLKWKGKSESICNPQTKVSAEPAEENKFQRRLFTPFQYFVASTWFSRGLFTKLVCWRFRQCQVGMDFLMLIQRDQNFGK